MRRKVFSPVSAAALGLSLAAALASGGAWAQTALSSQPSQQVQARVISATQVTDAQGRLAYDVAYEYNGRRYTTSTENHPGSTIPIEVNAYGVAAMPVAPQSQFEAGPPMEQQGRAPWDNVVPEQGMVVSTGRAAPPPVYYAPPVVYPAPVYAPAPVYVQPAYGYGYAPYAYPPIGLSLGIGYSRGWGGGHGRWR